MSQEKSFEQRLEVAKELLEKLKNPDINLKDAMKIYQEGKKELDEASKILQKAELEFEELNKESL